MAGRKSVKLRGEAPIRSVLWLPGGAEAASDMGVQVRKNSSTVFDGINNKTVEKGQILEIKETKGELMFEFRNFGGHGFELAAYNRYPEILATLH